MQNNTINTFKRHAVWAGIKPTGSLTLHSLRKSCITNWANEINNPEVVRCLAGHSDIKTTMQYYSAVTKKQRDKAARAINELLKAKKSSGKRYV
ncbi:tyrosine-type recombinase/integrase [Planctomycetota bacterium]